MALFGAAIGAIAGGIAGGISARKNAMAQADAYREYANTIRDAANKYSGQNAYNIMQNAANQEGNIANQRNLSAAAALEPGNNSAMMANNSDLSYANRFNEGYNLGQSNASNRLNSLYDSETAKAQQALKQAGIDTQARTAVMQGAMNTAGGLANLYNNFKPASSNNEITSDERVKEYDNHSGLPKADVDDALRRIESVNYKYKPEEGLDDEEHTGVTAQSLEGTAFDNIVSENDEGTKQLDKQMLLEATFAGIASLRKELDELESNDKITSDERCKQFENAIESNPVEAAAELPEGSDIQKEAEQVIDGGKDAEVRNDVIDEAVKKEPGSFINFNEADWLNFGKKQKRTRAEAKQAKQDALDELDMMSTADMRDISEMGGTANPYSPEVSEENPSAYGDDYKALSETVGNNIADSLQEEISPETLPAVLDNYDTSMYNFDWAYEVLPDEQKAEFEQVPDEQKAEWLKLHGFDETPSTTSNNFGGASSTTNEGLSIENTNNVGSTVLGNLYHPEGSSSGSISPESVPESETKKSNVEETNSIAGGGSKDINAADINASGTTVHSSGTESSGFVTSNGGSMSSGATSKKGSLKTSKSKLPNGESVGQPENNIDLKEATIENIKNRVAELPEGLAVALGFENDKFNGVKYEDADLQEADKVLSSVGV